MGAKTKAKAKPVPQRQIPPLPGHCEVLLSRSQVCYAIGVSVRSLTGMIASGEFPRAEAIIGTRPRWSVELVNGWVRAKCGRKTEA